MDEVQRKTTRARRLRTRWLLFFWRQARKIVMGVIGGTVLLIGIAGLVLPILPGWALIFVGFGILATEFAWARWVLTSAKDRLAQLLAQAEPPTVPMPPPA
ncbi:MAG TPA: PGPGW domain-containing protein, partial [Planctomycetaceae bacterium]|nr:PGPGW domain-containing protein [Planctomycetaceae bacterium]